MKKLSVYLLAVVASSLMLSCKSSTILTASFEGDAINSPPATNLPGNPTGDVIEYHAAVEPQLKVQNSTISGSKALHYTNVPINNPPPLASRWVAFKGIGADLTETLWFLHTGDNIGATISIDASDGHGHLMARMRIASSGEVGLATNIADSYSDIIGNVGSGAHTVVFTMFPATLKYNVTIIKASGPAITAENKPMITDNVLSFNNPAHPTLSFLNSEGSGGTYAIGSVTITRKDPN